MRKRATGIIIENGKILLIERMKYGQNYFMLPGGGLEENETIEKALIREIKEELCLDVKKFHQLLVLEDIEVPQIMTIHAGNRNEYLFQIDEYSGIPEIGGPEKERISAQNQYHIVWLNIEELGSRENIYPQVVARKLLEALIDN